MFDVSFWELCVVGVVALLVLGPEKLPKAARTAGRWIGKARRTFAEVQAEIEHELELEELKRLNQSIQSPKPLQPEKAPPPSAAQLQSGEVNQSPKPEQPARTPSPRRPESDDGPVASKQ
jgi:sec-independent protein translocase protein TatB